MSPEGLILQLPVASLGIQGQVSIRRLVVPLALRHIHHSLAMIIVVLLVFVIDAWVLASRAS